ncbi:MAG: D-alanyl-D-alanine carboxypeptidase family protein [Clostridia bacterium]|nr:D-alanyl-D-alanine carboxypeptidase family protein [Clostridia bacterium]
MVKKIICILFAAVLLVTPALAAAAPEHPVAAKGAILYELNTDTVLLEQDADARLYPASTTKLMTALVAMEYGNPEDIITVPAEAVDGLFELGSASYLLAGEEISFMDLMEYMLIASGNDAANAMAIHISGSISAFADLMNNRAQELGCTNTHFVNPHGLHDEEHYTSARDLLRIAKAAMQNPTIAEIVAKDEVVLPITNKHPQTTTKYTTNYLISRKSTREYYYEGAIGIKTGTTTPAGLCLVAACVKGDYTYYTVVLGAEKGENGERNQFIETAKLFDYGAENFSQQVMLSSSEPIAEVPVRLSNEKDSIVVTPSENITAMLPNAFETSDLTMKYTVEESVAAPVQAGDVLGKLTVSYEGKTWQLDLVASSDAARSTVLYILDRITGFFASTAFKIIVASIVALIVILVVYVILVNRRRAKRRRRRQ